MRMLQKCWLVSFHNEFNIFGDHFLPLFKILTKARYFLKSIAAVAFKIHLKLSSHIARFEFLADIVKALANQLHLKRIKLLRLYEHFLSHPYLAKIMQQRCIANLFHLLVIEMGHGVGTVGSCIYSLCQCLRVSSDAKGMARSRRVA